jgi:hypothetical protein
LEVRPQDRACSASALGLLPHGFVPPGRGDEIDSTDVLSDRVYLNQKNDQVFVRCEIERVNKTMWMSFGFWTHFEVYCCNFETEINYLVMTNSGNLNFLDLNICTL